ncbi:uncharacterized protein LOC107266731 isoform X2 [Cephus cinctus]|uniref:Uncharacterized protein LOC107266731 isoform X2 n=1 Tax=Cephus cinctus TaxID=211228 RepID=A0AAJ7BSZ4_CEPCN|nr:uncharacterized protein LOC107266731 isoform X2 [Cephus cinctus]
MLESLKGGKGKSIDKQKEMSSNNNSTSRTGLWLLLILVSCVLGNHVVRAEPEPESSGMFYSDALSDDMESQILLKRLRQVIDRKHEVIDQERELTAEQITLQAILEAKERDQRINQGFQRDFLNEDAEALPVPSAIVHSPIHSGKRTSYMALCHFKICNMGRKRQLLSEIRAKSLPLSPWLSLRSRTTAIQLPRP